MALCALLGATAFVACGGSGTRETKPAAPRPDTTDPSGGPPPAAPDPALSPDPTAKPDGGAVGTPGPVSMTPVERPVFLPEGDAASAPLDGGTPNDAYTPPMKPLPDGGPKLDARVEPK